MRVAENARANRPAVRTNAPIFDRLGPRDERTPREENLTTILVAMATTPDAFPPFYSPNGVGQVKLSPLGNIITASSVIVRARKF